MSTTVIDPRSVSFESIKQDLQNHVESYEDKSWRDFYASSAGTVVLELNAAIGAFLSHGILSAIRETRMNQARLRSSVSEMASLLGYTVNRKSAAKLLVTLEISEGQSIYWDRGDVIGDLNGNPVSLLRSTILNAGINTVVCVVGTWKSEHITITTSSDFARIFIPDGTMENDIEYSYTSNTETEVYSMVEMVVRPDTARNTVLGNVVPTSGVRVSLVTYAEELDSESCLVKTYGDGVVLVFGDGVFGKKVGLGDAVDLSYVSTSGALDSTTLKSLNTSLSLSVGTLQNFSLLYPGSNEDAMKKIKLIASSYNAARRRMITIPDHKAIIGQYHGVVSANARRVVSEDGCSACSVEATCLLTDGNEYYTLDKYSTDTVWDDPATITLSQNNVVFQQSVMYPSSLRIASSGFFAGLVTGVKVWMSYTSENGPYDVPVGIQPGNTYFWIIRVVGAASIRLATSYENAVNGSWVQLYPPPIPPGGVVQPANFDLSLDVFLDTAQLQFDNSFVNYEDDANISSSLNFGSSFGPGIVTGDGILFNAPSGLNYPPELQSGLTYYAIKVEGSNYIRFATSKANAESGIYIRFSEASSSPSGSVDIHIEKAEIPITLTPLNVNYSESDPRSCIDVGNCYITQGTGVPTGTKVRLTSIGGTLPTGLTSGEFYYIYRLLSPSTQIMFSADSVPNPDPVSGNCIELTNPGSGSGNIRIDVYANNGFPIDIGGYKPFIYEKAREESSSIDFSAVYFNGGQSLDFFRGQKVRLYRLEDDMDTVFPVGLLPDTFYYLIPLEDTTRLRFATSLANASSGTYVPLHAPAPVPPGAFGLMIFDIFSDHGEAHIDSSQVVYQNANFYVSSIDVGRGQITGTVDGATPGLATGTKLLLTQGDDCTPPVGIEFDNTGHVTYYLIRIPGTTNIRFATTKSFAMQGKYITMLSPIPGPVGGTILVDAYDNPEEKQLLAYLEPFRVAGERIYFTDPRPVYLVPKMVVVAYNNADLVSIRNSIHDLIYSKLHLLNDVFYIGDIVHSIMQLDGVMRVYLRQPTSDKSLDYDQYLTISLTVPLFSNDTIKITTDSSLVYTETATITPEDGYSDQP